MQILGGKEGWGGAPGDMVELSRGAKPTGTTVFPLNSWLWSQAMGTLTSFLCPCSSSTKDEPCFAGGKADSSSPEKMPCAGIQLPSGLPGPCCLSLWNKGTSRSGAATMSPVLGSHSYLQPPYICVPHIGGVGALFRSVTPSAQRGWWYRACVLIPSLPIPPVQLALWPPISFSPL